MSKTKRKERNEYEYLRGQIRKLESENRQLRKRLKQLDKKSHFYEDLIDAVAEDITMDNNCKKCRSGILRHVDLKYAQFLVCANPECQDRKKI